MKVKGLRFIDVAAITILLIVSSFFFFYKLSQTSLDSWDEAWYGTVSRNILITKDPINLVFNGTLFTDHPPSIFWLMSLSQSVFGRNEFGVRFVSASLGVAACVALYFLGRKMFSRVSGFASALALISCPWFVTRARTGNLDVPLATLFILVILFLFHLKGKRVYSYLFAVTLALLLLAKTMVPFTVLPAIGFVFLIEKSIRRRLFFSVLGAITPFVLWVIVQTHMKPLFIDHFLSIGLPGVGKSKDTPHILRQTKDYLYFGIGKWFWPSVLSLFAGTLFSFSSFIVLFILIVCLLTPFAFSEKGQIWHMIPVYSFMLLGFAGFWYILVSKFIKNKSVQTFIVLLPFLYVFFIQARANWYTFINVPAYVSDEAILSREAAKFEEPLYIDWDFAPVASYYSGKNVKKIVTDLKTYFDTDDSFLLITIDWKLNAADLPKGSYEIIKKDRDKLLVLKK